MSMTNNPLDSASVDPDRWEALARYLAGASTTAEAEAIRHWLAEDPACQTLVEVLNRPLGRTAAAAPAGLAVEAALQQVKNRRNEPQVLTIPPSREHRRARASLMNIRIAAAVVVLLGGTLLWRAKQNGTHDPADSTGQTFVTAVGQTDSLTLPDGSTVVLGPASRLLVAASYGRPARSVELQGEALFRVRHDEAQPFHVRVGNAMVSDLGTTFTVRGNGAGSVRVVVTEGSVRLRQSSAPPGGGVVLRAGDRGSIAPDGSAHLQAGAATETDLAWTRGRLVFKDAPLDDVIREIHRWYGITLHVSDGALLNRHITATFEREPAEQVLRVIGLALGTDVERRGDTAFVGTRALPR